MEFIYVLKLIERLIPEENWTRNDEEILSKHFNHLLHLKEKGQLLLAGKTAGQDHDTMGIVIFKADDKNQAEDIMRSDPAIHKGIMTGKLWEYSIAILNQEYKND